MTAPLSLVPGDLDSSTSSAPRLDAMTMHPAGSRRAGVDLIDIATGIAATARHLELGDGDDMRRFERVLLTPTYEAWVIRWSPSAELSLHDHGDSTGAAIVVDGELVEVRVAKCLKGAPWHRTLLAGDVITIRPDIVHSVSNQAFTDALSVHAYSPPLSTMTFYDRSKGQLTDTTTGRAMSPRHPLVP